MPSLLVTRLEHARMMPPRRDGTMKKRVGFGTDRAAELNPLLSFVEDWMTAPGGYVEHLHRGFETVTLVLCGQISSTDANGAQQLLLPGDVQWVTTGSGVMHAELPEGAGESHMIQLWLNLPAAQKLCPPRVQTVPASRIPRVELPGLTARVISGEFEAMPGAARAATSARVLDLQLEPGAQYALPIASGRVGIVYVAAGSITVGPHAAQAGDLVHFTSKLADALPLTASAVCHLVVVDAPKLQEPVVVNGPFIMNTAAQIADAYAEFRAGTFAASAYSNSNITREVK